MSKENFEALYQSMGKVKVMIKFGDMVSQELKEGLTFGEWVDIYVKTMPSENAKLKEEAFLKMFEMAKSPDELVAVYKYAEPGSSEEKTVLEKLSDDAAISLTEWLSIHANFSTGHSSEGKKKITDLAEKRIREILESK